MSDKNCGCSGATCNCCEGVVELTPQNAYNRPGLPAGTGLSAAGKSPVTILQFPQDADSVLAVTNGLASISIRTLCLDRDGALWIGTAGGGLSCWRSGKVVSFTAGEGLTMRTVSQIVEDDHGFLWLGGNSGIFKVNKRDLLDCADRKISFVHSRSFGINDGMRADECSGGFCPAGLKTKAGLICISTVRGLAFLNNLSFNKALFVADPSQCNLSIYSLILMKPRFHSW